MSEATKDILNFGSKANHGTTMGYQLFSYQLHEDYLETLRCCNAEPSTKEILEQQVAEILSQEVIALNTLENWINGNEFNLDATDKFDELDKVWVTKNSIQQLTEKPDLKYSDIRPIAGKADEM